MCRRVSGNECTSRASATPQMRPKMSRVSGRPGSASSTSAPASISMRAASLHRRHALPVHRRLEPRAAQHGDAQLGDPLLDPVAPVAPVVGQGVGVAQVVAGDGVEQQGGVAHAARHRPRRPRHGRRRRAAIAAPARSSASARPRRTRRRGCGWSRRHRCRGAAARTPPPPPRRHPAEEPPGVCAGFQGLRVMPCSGQSPGDFQPNSVVVVLPTITAPSAFSPTTLGASSAAGVGLGQARAAAGRGGRRGRSGP